MNDLVLGIRPAAPLALLLALAASACESLPLGDPDLSTGDESQALFFTQEEPQGAMMDALFEGRIALDAEGCLRAETLGVHPTVIWPAGYVLHADGGGLRVKDANGDVVGRVGESFHIGGGFGNLDYAGISEAERQLAAARCPGEIWIASTDWE
jgi:hypothetical protein